MATIIPNQFANAEDTIQLSKLDDNFNTVASAVDELRTDVGNIAVEAELSQSVYTAQIYIESPSIPSTPSGGSYNFSTNTFIPPTGWSTEQPELGNLPIYKSEYRFTTITPSINVTANTWSIPVIYAQRGVIGTNGLSVYTIEIYSTNISTTPSGGSYDFSTNTFNPTGLSSGWSATMPASSTIPTYRSSYTFSTSDISIPVSAGAWSTPVITALNGLDGINATSVVLTNDSHTIPTDSDGLNGIYTGSGTEIHVYDGTTELVFDTVGNSVGTYKVTAQGTNITPGTITITSPFATITNHSGITSDTASVTYTVTGKRLDGSNFNVVKIQSLSRSKSGIDGINATAYTLVSNTAIIKVLSDGSLSPSNVYLTLFSQTGNSDPRPYSGRFRIYEDNNATPSFESTEDAIAKFYTPSSSSISTIRVEAYKSGSFLTLIDTLSVQLVSDGIDSLSAVLSNATHALPADNLGNNITYSGSGTDIRVFEGTTELIFDDIGNTPSHWKVVATGNNITAGGISDSGNYATIADHSNMLADTASVTYAISGRRSNANPFSFNIIQTLSKTKAGGDATSYWILNSVAAVRKDNSGNYTPTNITPTILSQTGTNAPVAYAGRFIISTSSDGATYTNSYTSSSDESAYTFVIPGGITSIRISAYLSGGTTNKIDEQIIPIVIDGVVGSDGAQGNSQRVAYAVSSSTLANTPETIATTGNTSLPPNNSWGTGTIWTNFASGSLSAGQYLYQSNGIYYPETNETIWGVPFLSNLKVGSLSAITSNLGTITSGSINLVKFSVDSSGNTSINSGTTGARMEMTNSYIKVYDANNVLRVQIGDLGA